MKIPFAYRPSFGFVALVCAALMTTTFFAWGMGTPPLATVWRMDIELGNGLRGPLSKEERALLQRVISEHPEVADFLIEDKTAGVFSANDGGQVELPYAYLVRTEANQGQRLVVSYAGTASDVRVPVKIWAKTSTEEGVVGPGADLTWQPPADSKFPQLVELRFGPAGAEGTAHPVRIRWEPSS